MSLWQKNVKSLPSSGKLNSSYREYAKKALKIIIAVLLLAMAAGFLASSRMLIPVQSASKCERVMNSDLIPPNRGCYWDAQSFWYSPWGDSIVHKGIDIFAQEGDAVIASTYGIIIGKGYGSISGNYVKILGPGWKIQYYAHLKKSDVHFLQYAHKGKKIGEVGNTGNATGKPYHLHFSVTTLLPYIWRIDNSVQGWKKSIYLNPEEFFALPST